MSAASDRRGFLRALTTLPLIGGGVALLGNPTAAAVPLSPTLLDAYDEWLDLERSFLKWERFGPDGMDLPERIGVEAVFRNRNTGALFDYRTVNRLRGFRYGRDGDSPAARAAVVLATVGCDWRHS